MPRDHDLEEEEGYKVKRSEKAKAEIKTLDKSLREEVKNKIRDLENRPGQKGKMMRKPYHPQRQVRAGEGKYRILYEVKKDKKEIWVTTVKHKDDLVKGYH